jgi:hypothetical protein
VTWTKALRQTWWFWSFGLLICVGLFFAACDEGGERVARPGEGLNFCDSVECHLPTYTYDPETELCFLRSSVRGGWSFERVPCTGKVLRAARRTK